MRGPKGQLKVIEMPRLPLKRKTRSIKTICSASSGTNECVQKKALPRFSEKAGPGNAPVFGGWSKDETWEYPIRSFDGRLVYGIRFGWGSDEMGTG